MVRGEGAYGAGGRGQEVRTNYNHKELYPENSIAQQKPRVAKVTKTKKETQYNPLGAEVIKAFIEVDPKNKTYYPNKAQRAACDFLIDEYGLDSVLKVIKILPRTNKINFFPKVNSPNDLKEKWVNLKDSVERKRSEQSEVTKKFKVAFT